MLTPEQTEEENNDGPTPEISAYFQAIGKFVTVFSQIEKILFATSGLVLRLPLPITQAVFSDSAGVQKCIERINRTLNAALKHWPNEQLTPIMKQDFENVFAQLSVISRVRNGVLHNGPELGPGDEWSVTNRHLKPDGPTEIRISVAAVEAMCEDLAKITFVLIHYNIIMELGQPGLDDVYSEYINKPWRYSSPTSQQTSKKRQKNLE